MLTETNLHVWRSWRAFKAHTQSSNLKADQRHCSFEILNWRIVSQIHLVYFLTYATAIIHRVDIPGFIFAKGRAVKKSLIKIWECSVIDQRVFPFGFSLSDYVNHTRFNLFVNKNPFSVAWRSKPRPGFLVANPEMIVPQALRNMPLEIINEKCR
jgi:hypothetical protein